MSFADRAKTAQGAPEYPRPSIFEPLTEAAIWGAEPTVVVRLEAYRAVILAPDRTGPPLVSRAPLPKLDAYKAQKGWNVPWLSSFGSEFNYDFHVTNDEKVAPLEYNYRNKAEMEARKGPNLMVGEEHGLSVFFRLDDDVFHTYSVYARGTESLTDAYSLLDTTPYGRQQDFEDSPPGWPQRPTYG